MSSYQGLWIHCLRSYQTPMELCAILCHHQQLWWPKIKFWKLKESRVWWLHPNQTAKIELLTHTIDTTHELWLYDTFTSWYYGIQMVLENNYCDIYKYTTSILLNTVDLSSLCLNYVNIYLVATYICTCLKHIWNFVCLSRPYFKIAQ